MERDHKLKQQTDLHLWWLQFELEDDFPKESSYENSAWWHWAQRIKEGQVKEQEELDNFYSKRQAECSGSDDEQYWLENWAVDDYAQTRQVTGTMYAGLIVSMWAKIEYMLKQILSTCLCDPEKEERPKVSANIKAIKKDIKDKTGINLLDCEKSETVNAIRILNNCFKHTDGRYRSNNKKPLETIKKYLIQRWNIVGNHEEIDYSKLPIKELVVACGAFGLDLLGKVKNALEKPTAEKTKRISKKFCNSMDAL
jgi:hypothetical protein